MALNWSLGLFGAVVGLMISVPIIWSSRQRDTERDQRVRGRWDAALIRGICDTDEQARIRTSMSIYRRLSDDDRSVFAELALNHLRELRGTQAENVRWLLSILGFPERSILQLRDEKPWERGLAARMLGELRYEPAEPALIAALDDPDALVSLAVARSLVQIGTDAAVRAVSRALETRDDWSESLVEELLCLSGIAIGPAVSDILRRQAASAERLTTLVHYVGDVRHLPSTNHLVALLFKPVTDDLRIALLRALGKVGRSAVIPFAREALVHDNWAVRAEGARTLGRLVDHASIRELRDSLVDTSFWVRLRAAEALANLGEQGADALWRAEVHGPDGHEEARELRARRRDAA